MFNVINTDNTLLRVQYFSIEINEINRDRCNKSRQYRDLALIVLIWVQYVC